jgi:hypothetical protein
VKVLIVSLLVVLAVQCSGAQEVKVGSSEFARILRDGALAKFSLKIVDDDGAVVSNANVQVSFAMEDSQWILGQSDTNGVFTAAGQSRGEMLFDITKDGYYRTADKLKFGRHDGIVVKDGKWQPWNPEIRVLLRPIVNPVPMYAKRVDVRVPVEDTLVGYDLVVGDWVSPYGKEKLTTCLSFYHGV